MPLFTRPTRRPFADLVRALTEVREYASTAAANTAHMIRQLDDLKELVMTDPGRNGQATGDNRDGEQPTPAHPDGPKPADNPDPPRRRR